MLTNPSPNARTARAVSRRRTLRRLRWELLIGGAAEGIYLKNLATHSGRSNRCLRRLVFGAVRVGCAPLWSSHHYGVLGAAAWSVTFGARAASACTKATVARTFLDRSSVGLMCGWVSSSRTQFGVGTRDVWPIDRHHERIDIGGRSRAVIHVIRVLVHIERQNRAGAGERRGVVHGPLIDELAIARRPSEQHPA